MKRLTLPLLAFLIILAGCDGGSGDEDVIIEDVVIGTGKIAELDSMIQVVYTASVQDGDVFITDGSLEEPTVLRTLISGWVEGLQGMRAGGRRILTVPPSKAFGNREVVDDSLNVLVPANSTVIFDIELTSVGPRPVQIVDLTTGTGDEARVGSIVTVNYTGSLDDGTVFDVANNSAFALSSGSLIEGWIIGVPGMRVGGRRQLVIPSELGYSSDEICFDPARVCTDPALLIPPFSTLNFDIELIAVE